MPVDEGLVALFAALDDGSPFDLARARAGLEEMVAGVAVTVPVDEVADGRVAGVPVRTYRPADPGGTTLVWLHGGGWVSGTLDAVDPLCRELAVRAGLTVVSVDYRLAPEHPYPAAVEDAVAVLRAVDAPGPLAVGGDSAGGNLAAAAAARVRGEVPLAAQVLLCPALDATLSWPSVQECATGYGLTAEAMERFVALYVGDTDPADPGVSPLRDPDLRGLPPAVVVTAEYDPLRDEAEEHARRLAAAGVPVRARRWDGMVHGFHAMSALTPCADEALAWTAAALREVLPH